VSRTYRCSSVAFLFFAFVWCALGLESAPALAKVRHCQADTVSVHGTARAATRVVGLAARYSSAIPSYRYSADRVLASRARRAACTTANRDAAIRMEAPIYHASLFYDLCVAALRIFGDGALLFVRIQAINVSSTWNHNASDTQAVRNIRTPEYSYICHTGVARPMYDPRLYCSSIACNTFWYIPPVGAGF
jgi:hypothetical protein